MRRRSLTAVLLALATSAAASPAAAADCAGEAWTESTLYMGRGLGDGRMAGDAEVRAFVDETIVPLFPDGFTVFDARGHWRDRASGRAVDETTVVFVVVHPPGQEAEASLRRIAEAYNERFRQSTVLASSHPVCDGFIDGK